MLIGFLSTLFVFVCVVIILLILVQKGKGSMGMGGLGGGTQMLFGGTGGQDLFQKATWALGLLFIFGSLILALAKSSTYSGSTYLDRYQAPVTSTHAPQTQTEQPD